MAHTAHDALEAIWSGGRAADLESETIDFKRTKPSTEDAYRDLADAALCFANSQGGVIVVGVDDKASGPNAILGTDLDPAAVQQRIHQLTSPALLVSVVATDFRGKRLLVISVAESPVVHGDTKGRASHRVNSDCVPMTPVDHVRIAERKSGVDWSAKKADRANSDASGEAIASAKRILATLTDERQQLANLARHDLLTALGAVGPDGALRRAGELLLCANAASAQPRLVYQFRETAGGEPRDVQRIDLPLILGLQRCLELIQARRRLTPVTLPNGQAIELADFPELAVREALVNAVAHRDYALPGSVIVEHSPQVLVITSPGPLVRGITPENILTHPSTPRNPVLARALRTLGFAEEVGRGVDRMYREMIRSGRQLPRIEATPDHVRVSLVGGAPNTNVARFVATLPEAERGDTDTMLIVFKLCAQKTVTAEGLSPLLQKSADEAESVLRRLATEDVGLVEATRQTMARARPTYRLRSAALKALGTAVSYQRRTVDETDAKIIEHVREYGHVTNRTVQNLLDVSLIRARDILRDLVRREVLRKESEQERGPGVEYGPGIRFPAKKTRHSKAGPTVQDPLPLRFAGRRNAKKKRD